MTAVNSSGQELSGLSDLLNQRREKLGVLRKAGNAWPNQFRRSHLTHEIGETCGEKTAESLAASSQTVQVAGRVMTRRLMGKASFFHLQDMTGRLQIYVRQQDVGEAAYAAFLEWDIGDIVGVVGKIFKTRTGELSVHAETVCLLAKSLRPLPDKYHGLHDQETRYRQRYLDLMVNETTRTTFILRTRIIDVIRDFLKQRGFLEVETPMMQVLPGGAAAKPFVTHHHALDIPLYLRIAPELYLKRLVVGGFERVFEINRNFRNEGLSTRHNPEFTMLEFYQAYTDYNDLIMLTAELFRKIALTVAGGTAIPVGEHTIDFSPDFVRMTVEEAILAFNPALKGQDLRSRSVLAGFAESLGIPVHAQYGSGKIQLEIFEKTVEHQLIQPTCITAYPSEVSPLARKNDDDDFVTDRFELFVAGREIANGFSELNDPEDQAARFRDQGLHREAGDEEAMPYDEDYVTALEYGLPPTAGEGIGIDRLVMLFANVPSIRDVILFPHMRPAGKP